MGGCDENRACVRRRFDPCADVNALPIDGDRTDPRASGHQGLSRQWITWIFYPNLLVRARKESDYDIKSVLRARRDYDLFGIASHRSSRLQVIADCFSKFGRSPRVRISKVAPVQR